MKTKKITAAAVFLAAQLLIPVMPASAEGSEAQAVTTGDLRRMEHFLLGSDTLSEDDPTRLDINVDGINNAYDMVLLRRSFIDSGMQVRYTTRSDRMFIEYNSDIINADSPIHTAVIRTAAELDEYMTEHYYDTTAKAYLDTYNDEYFADNVLLLVSVFQKSGTASDYDIYSVNCLKNSLNILASSDGKGDTSVLADSVLLLQVTVPDIEYVELPLKFNGKDYDPDKGDNPHPTEPPTNAPTAPPTQPPTEPPTQPVTQAPTKKKLLRVANILQKPELPTGCEVTALTTLMNHLGVSVNKMTLARNYLPKMDFYWENGIYYGADFRTTFAGDPESEYSYGCYAPCIVTTANSYFTAKDISAKAYNTTGTTLDDLITGYIDNNVPVLIWITSSNLHESYLTSIWTTPAGEQVQWRAYEHCVVLTGYDKDKNVVYVADPLIGTAAYNYDLLNTRFKEMGQQSVYIKN